MRPNYELRYLPQKEMVIAVCGQNIPGGPVIYTLPLRTRLEKIREIKVPTPASNVVFIRLLMLVQPIFVRPCLTPPPLFGS